tara:strand:+ start:105 stop:1931 length:1827 start_codon:yes stop_codon:yes gene_type:complete
MVLSNATCTVYVAGTSTAATLYSDNGITPLANPFLSSSTGQVAFYAANGTYDLVVSKIGYLTVTISAIELDDLLAPSGSNSVGYLPAGTGAVATTVQTKLRESVSVKDFGAVGDDATDDTAAIQAAINSISAVRGGSVYFPAGLYKVTSQLNITGDNITLFGDGQRSSAIRVYHNSGYGILVQDSVNPGTDPVFNFSMRNMCIRARIETTVNACLYLNNILNCAISNVSLEDHFGGLLIGGGNEHYYSNFMVSSARTTAPVSWTGVKTGSFYLRIDQSSTGDLPYNLYFVNFNFQRNDSTSLVNNGVVINCVDGAWFSNGHIQGVGGANLWLNCIDSTKQLDAVFFNNVWFDSDSIYGVRITGSSSVFFQQVNLIGCNFLRPSVNGILFDSSANCEGINVVGGWMIQTGSYGIVLNSGSSSSINGMFFGACNQDGAASTSAIAINSGVDNVRIQNCEFNQTTHGVTSSLMQGVRIANAASENILISNNAFKLDAAMVDIQDLSTSDTNAYPNNITTKAATATSVAGSSLVIPEIGDVFSVSAGLNFSNMTGRWYGRQVTLRFLGASTVSQGTIRLSGSVAFVAKAGDTLSLAYESSGNFWYETSRMVS